MQNLRDRYDQAVAKRAAEKAAMQPFLDRVEAITHSPRFTTTDFWCATCQRDCQGTGYRQVSTIRERWPTAWFVGYCPTGHKVLRRITDKNTDPYYDSSYMVKRMRFTLRDDLLTPEDPRFKVLYPRQWEELYGKSQEPKSKK